MYRKMYDNARLYSSAAWILGRNSSRLSEQERYRLVPSQILAALALEQYFRSLYFALNGRDFQAAGRESYGIFQIFDSFDSTLKQQMEADFRTQLRRKKLKKGTPRDLEENLKAWSEMLAPFRDPSATNPDTRLLQIWFFREIENVVINRLREIKPELRNVAA